VPMQRLLKPIASIFLGACLLGAHLPVYADNGPGLTGRLIMTGAELAAANLAKKYLGVKIKSTTPTTKIVGATKALAAKKPSQLSKLVAPLAKIKPFARPLGKIGLAVVDREQSLLLIPMQVGGQLVWTTVKNVTIAICKRSSLKVAFTSGIKQNIVLGAVIETASLALFQKLPRLLYAYYNERAKRLALREYKIINQEDQSQDLNDFNDLFVYKPLLDKPTINWYIDTDGNPSLII